MLGTEEREEEREGQACTREEGHDSWKVLGIKIACLCECVAQRTLYGREDGARVDTGEGRVAYVLEEAKVVVGSHGDEVESRRGEVDGQDEGTTYTEVSSFCGKKKEWFTHGSANDGRRSRRARIQGKRRISRWPKIRCRQRRPRPSCDQNQVLRGRQDWGISPLCRRQSKRTKSGEKKKRQLTRSK